MATAPSSSSRERRNPAGEVVEYSQYVDEQLRRTRSQVRWVDVMRGLLHLATGGLLFLLLAALADHLTPGGLGFWPRLLLCAVFLVGSVTYFVLRLLPVLTRPINLVYAAHTIERSRPTLKNSLVNFLLLRGEKSRMPGVVFQAIEQKAATDLSGVPVETAVDRGDVIRAGYLLMGVVAAFCIYTLVSPKSPVHSVGRVLFPWAGLAPATRVTISEIKPGNASKFNGDYLPVSAVVQGLRKDEPVTVYFTTVDGQSVDRPAVMSLPTGTYRHQAELPPDGDGLQQSLEYYIAAGDAMSPRYRVQVISSPAIDVEAVDYNYPDYTGLENRTVAFRGDIQAIEGTEVTIRAKANQPIGSAYIDLNCDNKRDTPLVANGDRAQGTLKLTLDKEGKAEFDRYQLRFTNKAGDPDLHPIRHRVEITADEPPEIAFTAPEKDDVSVPENGALNLAVRAKDADFALLDVIISFQRDGKLLDEARLLDGPRSDEFIGTHVLEIAKLGVKAGDTVIYWAEARDNRQPEANRTRTVEHRLHVTPPVSAKKQQEQLAEAQKEQQQAQQQEQQQKGGQGEPGDKQQAGQQQPGDKGEPTPDGQAQEPQANQQPNEGGEQQQRPVSQDSPGDAFEEILKHRQQQEAEKPKEEQQQQQESQQQQGEKQQGEKQQSGQQSQQGDQKGQQQQQQSQGEGQQSKEGSGQQQAGEKGDAQQAQSGAQQAGDKPGQSDQKSGGQEKQGGEGAQKQAGEASQSQDQTGAGAQQQQKQPDKEGQQAAGESQGEQGAKPSDAQRSQGEGKPKPDGKSAGSDAAKQGDQAAGQQNAGNQDKPGTQGAADQRQQQTGQQAGAKPGEQAGQPAPGEQQAKPSANGQQQETGAQHKPASGSSGNQGDKQKPSGEERQQGTGAQANDRAQHPQDANQRQANPNAKGKGDRAPPPSGRPEQPKDPSQSQQQDKATGGEPNQPQGESGAGQPGKGNPSASPQEASKPRDKAPGSEPGKTPQDKGETASSPNIGQNESDSKGGEQGDRKGGGKEGGGQKANQPGTGGAGQNTAAEQGASQSKQKGKGETSGRAGEQAESKGATGKSGDKQGSGSSSRQGDSQSGDGQQSPDGAAGQQSGPRAPGNTPGSGGKSTPNRQQQGKADKQGDATDDREAGEGKGPGGQPGDPQENEPGKEPGADNPNLAYADKATDLALEHLKDQLAKQQPDKDLLDKLGWTRDDLEKFLARWEQMKQAAKAEGPEGDKAREKLKDALESLGLNPRATAIRGREGGDDQLRNLQESRRSAPPPEFADQFRAYTEGTSKAKQ